MSKKSKKGKQRKDSYYHKAKIAGFRARSAYKLVQLNSKYEFLQRSRVCVDLCAAPGSWMQVAKKYMPLSSIIVGIDLFPIKPMQGAISIQGDITTEKARQDIKATLKTWKADVVLHDGAPHVGQNWLFDAYQQNLLVLHAFKLACELLQKGGWFVTKVFRSKDYFNLEYIFRKLFKKVEATKPQASRYESAEIFVVCQGYLDPAKIDPQFFSAKHVFEEINLEPTNKMNLLKPEKTKAKAEGYAEGATTLYNKVPVSEFIKSVNYVEVLQGASELEFDIEAMKTHPLTTQEIIENCKDIKVLGRKDLRLLITWRKKMQEDYKKKQQEEEEKRKEAAGEQKEEKTQEEKDEEELDLLQKKIMALKAEQELMEKSALKRKAKERKKLEEKMRIKSVIPGDSGPTEATQDGLFDLNKLAQVQNMDTVLDQEANIVLSESEEEVDDGPTYVRYDKETTVLDKSGRFYIKKSEEKAEKPESDPESEDEGLGFKGEPEGELPEDGDKGEETEIAHPLITDLVGDSRAAKRARKAETWFSQDIFNDLETEMDEDYEVEAAIEQYKAEGGKMVTKDPEKMTKKELKKHNTQLKKEEMKKKQEVREEKKKRKKKRQEEKKEEKKKKYDSSESGYTSSPEADSGKDSDLDADTEEVQGPQMPKEAPGGGGGTLSDPKKRKKGSEDQLDPVGLALATKMIYSKKAKRDIMDTAWNRYMFGDEDDLPSWFTKDETKHNKIRIEVEPEDLRMYRDRSKNVNARTIKKVVEAKARKQRRTKRRMEKARKKSENITNNAELSEREKAQEVKKLYKKAMAPLKKKETKYIVMKKKFGGQKPKGTKGPYKLVDKRLKKDTNSQKRAAEKKKSKGKRR